MADQFSDSPPDHPPFPVTATTASTSPQSPIFTPSSTSDRRRRSNSSPGQIFLCRSCTRSFTSSQDLVRHQNADHNIEKSGARHGFPALNVSGPPPAPLGAMDASSGSGSGTVSIPSLHVLYQQPYSNWHFEPVTETTNQLTVDEPTGSTTPSSHGIGYGINPNSGSLPPSPPPATPDGSEPSGSGSADVDKDNGVDPTL